ncbi:translesion error-prone DNA polymerase V subunit UmuC [Geothermobacter hydrogeniphilus]|uniref:DNA polymerase V subunit UmuC n=1 Tax=Geothermobacter hydrogeniphilus TaxID=1969733 RepID=A0A1X0Y8C1_9BACT|nr:translesion error-prone DNA polymerase V subunit UmuC [Geothermobacter hydrogeniphilus]ORJ61349.1 DNA polymerase V subunit UmuC [Geothermobacter hydrogeniphilus]
MTMFALVDCNNFYCSCERLFRPDLKRVPVVVLSNNDGCIVARSQEAKDLGIKMGTPLFKARNEIKRYGIRVFSSNYTLYGDISSRVMQTLEQFSPRMEIYSIDEAFLDLSGTGSWPDYGQQIRSTVKRHVGVPVSVGIAPTKTLAKLANYAAKKFRATRGVVDLSDPRRQQRLLALTPVSEIWGIGRNLTRTLERRGMRTALDLAQINPRQAKRLSSVVLERTVRELNGESCIELDEVAAPKQQIVCSRSFGEKLTDYSKVREAICEFTARAAEKLRREKLAARMVNVFIRTSPFDNAGPKYSNSATGTLPQSSSDTLEILALATRLFDMIWKEGCRYAKTGIMLGDFCSPDRIQLDLFDMGPGRKRSDNLMRVIDTINQGGQGKVWFGGQRPQKNWFMRQENLSPAYTTKWNCIPVVK